MRPLLLCFCLCLFSGLTQLSAAETNAKPPLVVNGHALHPKEQGWVEFVAKVVVPQLKGDRAERIKVAAEVSWWGLKEGIYRTANPIAFSSCSRTQKDGKSKNVRLGPLEVCETGRTWQVGLSAVQVPNFSEQKVLDTVKQLWPDKSASDILQQTVRIAGYKVGDPTANAIVHSTGVLQKSWLLRHPAVGFTLVDANIRGQCIDSSHGYCYGTGWPETAAYAPTRDAAMKSIADLRAIYESLAPK